MVRPSRTAKKPECVLCDQEALRYASVRPTDRESEDVDEKAADDFAISKIRSAGIKIPVWMFFQYNARHNAWPDFDSLLTLDSDAVKYTLK
jgi:hypothetical protein